jgi:hypothetical protein
MKHLIIILVISLSFFSCESYGEKAKSGYVEVYYETEALKNKATEIAKYLDKNEFSKDHTTSFKLTKDSLYNVRMVVKEGAEKDASNDMTFMSIGYVLSMEVFNNQPINFMLCDNSFKTLKTIPITASIENK